MEWVVGLDRVVRRLELDTASGRAQIEFTDGRTASEAVTRPAPPGTTVIRTLPYCPACTVLLLSGGWRMLHPVRVRKLEFAAAVADGRAPARSQVFAVDSDGLFTVSDADSGDPRAQIALLVERLAVVAANADVLLDPEAVDMVKPTGWAQYYAGVAGDPAFQALARPRRRRRCPFRT